LCPDGTSVVSHPSTFCHPAFGSYANTQGYTIATFGFPQQEPFVPHRTCFCQASFSASEKIPASVIYKVGKLPA